MQLESDERLKQSEFTEVNASSEKKIIKSFKTSNLSSSGDVSQNNPNQDFLVSQGAQSKQYTKKTVEYIYLDDPKFKLGQGSYGAVFKCYTKQNNKIYRFAVKVIRIPEYNGSIASGQDVIHTTRQQIKTLMKFKNNPNIIKIQDLIRDQKIIYLVLEYCNDKDIISYLKRLRGEDNESGRMGGKKNGIGSIEVINGWMGQLLNGFKDLYENNIVHRDFKPGNILVSNGVLKIADFGQSKPVFNKSELMSEYVGTLCTSSPQVRYKQDYTMKCDIYSLGVVYYWMIYGKYPYKDMISKEQYLRGKMEINPIGYDGFIITEQVINLIKSMTAYKQSDRPDWNDLFNHRMFTKYVNKKIESNSRMTFDRGMTMIQSQDFNQQIPEEFYKYINEKDIHLNRISVDQYQDFISVMRSINQFNLKVFFFKQLLKQLSAYSSKENSQTQIEEQTICDVLRLGIQKYIILLNKELQAEITFKDIPKIIDKNSLRSLQNQQNFNTYSKDLLHEIRSFEDSQQRPKLSKDKISQLIKKCHEYKVYDQFAYILRDLKEGVEKDTLLNEISKVVIELIFLLKPEVKSFNLKKKQLKTSSEQNRFRYIILLLHHLNMFVMNKEIFTQRQSSMSNSQSNEITSITDFMRRQKFQDRFTFQMLAHEIQFLLQKFQE